MNYDIRLAGVSDSSLWWRRIGVLAAIVLLAAWIIGLALAEHDAPAPEPAAMEASVTGTPLARSDEPAVPSSDARYPPQDCSMAPEGRDCTYH